MSYSRNYGQATMPQRSYSAPAAQTTMLAADYMQAQQTVGGPVKLTKEEKMYQATTKELGKVVQARYIGGLVHKRGERPDRCF